MENINNYWNAFINTGSINDYIRYKKSNFDDDVETYKIENTSDKGFTDKKNK